MEPTITITLKADGNVDMTGPLHDKIFCYGLLEVAKNLVKDYKPSEIVKPSNGEINLIKKQ